ncbi:MAG: hypothetical protein AABY10_06200 [Nanoarchaeota archaeon]
MSRRPVSEDKLVVMRNLYVDGIHNKEISVETGIPCGTVRSYVHAWNNGFDSPTSYNNFRLATIGENSTDYCNRIRERNRNSPNNQIFAGYVTAGIVCLGKSRRDIASEIGCDTDTLRLWSNGSAIPLGEKLRRVCEVLDIPYDWIRTIAEKKKREARKNAGRLEMLSS